MTDCRSPFDPAMREVRINDQAAQTPVATADLTPSLGKFCVDGDITDADYCQQFPCFNDPSLPGCADTTDSCPSDPFKTEAGICGCGAMNLIDNVFSNVVAHERWGCVTTGLINMFHEVGCTSASSGILLIFDSGDCHKTLKVLKVSVWWLPRYNLVHVHDLYLVEGRDVAHGVHNDVFDLSFL